MLSKLQHLGLMIKNTIIKHPLEILFVTYITIVLASNVAHYETFQEYGNLIALSPLCFVLLYLLRNTKVYWFLTPIPILVALFFNKISLDLMIDSRYWAVLFCTFLCLLSQYWYKDNHNFIDELTNKLVNLVFAGALASIVFAALSCITFAIIALFNLDKYDNFTIFERFGIFSTFWAFPVFFLTLEQKHATNDSKYLNRIGEMLLGWILSPALMIYTAIIYAYVIFIAIQGEMPNGVVANVAFPYLSIGLAIQAVQLLLKNAKWQLFYRYFAYLALLPLALIWYAIYIRLSSYGLTEARIYLVIGATTLTICYLLLITKRFAQYRLFSALSIVMILVSVFILDPRKIALEDQTKRFDDYLVQHKLLDENNKISTQAIIEHQKSLDNNSNELEPLHSMIHYLAREYPVEQFKQKYGVESRYDLIYTQSDREYELNFFEAYNADAIRLRKDDFKNAQEFLVINSHFSRLSPYNYNRISEDKCQKPTHQEYNFNTSDSTVKYEEVDQDCEQIKKEPLAFIISFSGIEPTIQFNMDELVKNIFIKHNLDMEVRHPKETLETLKADLLKLDLSNNAILSLRSIRLEFIENTGYVVESFSTRYLMLK